MQSTLDESLLDRAHKAAKYAAVSELTAQYRLPAWMLGAGDVRIAFVTDQPDLHARQRARRCRSATRGRRSPSGDKESSVRTISAGGTRYRVVTVPAATPGQALVHRPVARAAGEGPRQARWRDAALRRRRRGRGRHGRLGGRAQRPASGPPADHRRRGHRPHRGPHPAPGRGRRRDRPPGHRVQPDARRAGGVPRPAAAAGRRRRARAAHPAHVAAHQPRPALAGRRVRARGLRPRPARSCSTTSARRSRS